MALLRGLNAKVPDHISPILMHALPVMSGYFNDINEFSAKDLERIYSQEARFLSKASCVFFRSQWAARRNHESL
jgi:hypothetical protein